MAEEFHILGISRRRGKPQGDAVKWQPKGYQRDRGRDLKRRCTVCNHPDLLKIEFQLANGGCSYRGLAQAFGLNYNAVENHHKAHMSPARLTTLRLKNPLENDQVLQDLSAKAGVSALENLRAVHAGVISRWLNALETKSDQYFISLTAQARANIELMAKLGKELAPSQTNVVVQNNIGPFERPEYVDAIATIVAALRPFPEARRAVAEALRSLEIARCGGPLIEAKPVKPV